MRRPILLILGGVFVLTACASSTGDPTTGGVDSTTTSLAIDSSTRPTPPEEATSPSTSVPGTTGTTSDRPLAPDFTLELGDGGTYTLSEGAKPVYLVFWAEW